jgi:hypothetical protein
LHVAEAALEVERLARQARGQAPDEEERARQEEQRRQLLELEVLATRHANEKEELERRLGALEREAGRFAEEAARQRQAVQARLAGLKQQLASSWRGRGGAGARGGDGEQVKRG